MQRRLVRSSVVRLSPLTPGRRHTDIFSRIELWTILLELGPASLILPETVVYTIGRSSLSGVVPLEAQKAPLSLWGKNNSRHRPPSLGCPPLGWGFPIARARQFVPSAFICPLPWIAMSGVHSPISDDQWDRERVSLARDIGFQ